MTRRSQIWDGTSGVGVLDDDNILTLDPAELRQDKYDEIRAEMQSRIDVISESWQEEKDKVSSGRSPDSTAVTALEASRDAVRVKAQSVKAQVDARGDDNEAIHSFRVKEDGFDA